MPAVGNSVARKDGIGKATGSARYADDITFPGMIHGRTVRSTIPRGVSARDREEDDPIMTSPAAIPLPPAIASSPRKRTPRTVSGARALLVSESSPFSSQTTRPMRVLPSFLSICSVP